MCTTDCHALVPIASAARMIDTTTVIASRKQTNHAKRTHANCGRRCLLNMSSRSKFRDHFEVQKMLQLLGGNFELPGVRPAV